MQRGNLRVKRDKELQLWVIQGRQRTGWINVSDGEMNLQFDLQYDACGYLENIVQWFKETNRNMNTRENKKVLKHRKKRKHKNKAIKKTKRRNR